MVPKLLIIPDAHAEPNYDNDRFTWRGFLLFLHLRVYFAPLFALIAALTLVVGVLLPPDWFLVRLVELRFLRPCLLLVPLVS